MAKEWDKFLATYKKLEPKLKIFDETNADKKSQVFRLAYANCSAGENNISDAMVTARENGVTGTEMKDFLKDKG